MQPKTFLITGASSGFGRAIFSAAVAAGHKAVGTVRRDADRQALESLDSERAKVDIVDVTQLDILDDFVARIQHEHGPIDVLVNSAGYGHEGVLEESPVAELRRQLDVNLFG